MIGLIALALSVVGCILYCLWTRRDHDQTLFRDEIFIWFATAVAVIGIVLIWVYGFPEFKLSLWSATKMICWTPVLGAVAFATLCINFNADDKDDDEDSSGCPTAAEIETALAEDPSVSQTR